MASLRLLALQFPRSGRREPFGDVCMLWRGCILSRSHHTLDCRRVSASSPSMCLGRLTHLPWEIFCSAFMETATLDMLPTLPLGDINSTVPLARDDTKGDGDGVRLACALVALVVTWWIFSGFKGWFRLNGSRPLSTFLPCGLDELVSLRPGLGQSSGPGTGGVSFGGIGHYGWRPLLYITGTPRPVMDAVLALPSASRLTVAAGSSRRLPKSEKVEGLVWRGVELSCQMNGALSLA